MPFTPAEYERSRTVVMRCSISTGAMPWYCQITVTTGIGIVGKMSTGVVRIAKAPPMSTRMATEMKVYGRRSATRTSHIMAADSQIPPEQRFERRAGDLVGELRAHEIELGLHERGLRREHVENRGDAGAIARLNDAQVLPGESHRLARERDVLLCEVDAAEQPLRLCADKAPRIERRNARDLGGRLGLRD